jgi:hypothetical protein
MTDVGAPAPEVYRLSMEKLPLAVARARRLALVLTLVVATALVAAISLPLREAPLATDASLALWGLAAVLVPYILWRTRVRVRRRWNAFELSIGPTNMRCAARGSGRVTMRLDAIASVTEGATGLVVRSNEDGAVIHIPRTVEGFIAVRARLERVRGITARADARAWCGALFASGLVAAFTASVWGRDGCVAAGVLACQAAAAYAAGVEIWWHPRLAGARKLGALAVLGAATLLPVCGLAARALTLALR